MKIISLNIWGGSLWTELSYFLEKQKIDTDVFCFQEVSCGGHINIFEKDARVDVLSEIKEILVDYDFFVFAHEKYLYAGSIVICVKKGKEVVEGEKDVLSGWEIEHKEIKHWDVGVGQIVNIRNKNLNILNVHGMWSPGEKLDTEVRIKQSEKIIEMLGKVEGEFVVIGDFNLEPNTQSIEMLSAKYINLNRKFGITDTRGSKSKYFGREDYQSYADYVFCSKNLENKILSLEAPDAMVSDHRPMILELLD